jgi:hypothetical protein
MQNCPLHSSHGIGCITTFPVARFVSMYEKASTTWVNGNGPLGSITGFTFPLSKYGFSFLKTAPLEVTTNLKPGGVTAPVKATTLPPSFTTFTALSHCPVITEEKNNIFIYHNLFVMIKTWNTCKLYKILPMAS